MPHTIEIVQHDTKPQVKPDYVAIATPLVQRGFWCTPVHPEEKHPVLPNWPNHFDTTLADIQKTAAEGFAEHNVGVVSKVGDPNKYAPRLMFLDCDMDGIVERIKAETGHDLLAEDDRTYTVMSQPSRPYKLHFYFRQTPYSFEQFRRFQRRQSGWDTTNMSRKDVASWKASDSGRQIHPEQYVVKGIGGGSIVVAAGSVRANGEIYTPLHDVEIIPIPGWLVDWLIVDFSKSLWDKHKEDVAKYAAKLAAKSRSKVQQGIYDIDADDTASFLRWRACQLAGLGLTRELVQQALPVLAANFCENGKVFAESDAGKSKIEAIANDPNIRFGHSNALQFYLRKPEGLSWGMGVAPPQPPPAAVVRQNLMVACAQKFPAIIRSTDAYAAFKIALAEHGGFDRNISRLREQRTQSAFRRRLYLHPAEGRAYMGAPMSDPISSQRMEASLCPSLWVSLPLIPLPFPYIGTRACGLRPTHRLGG